MQNVVPALRIRSYEASKPFYEKLGFEEQWKRQFEPGLPLFASIACDAIEIFLTEHTQDCQFGDLVHFYIASVDECYAQFLQRGVLVKEPPSNSLGSDIRNMLLLDPDRNRLRFLTRSAEANK